LRVAGSQIKNRDERHTERKKEYVKANKGRIDERQKWIGTQKEKKIERKEADEKYDRKKQRKR
jgi:hypothetical protein